MSEHENLYIMELKLSNKTDIEIHYSNPFIEIFKNKTKNGGYAFTAINARNITSIKTFTPEKDKYAIYIDINGTPYSITTKEASIDKETCEKLYTRLMMYWRATIHDYPSLYPEGYKG